MKRGWVGVKLRHFKKEPNRIRLRRRNRRGFFLGVGGSWLVVGLGPYGARNGKDYHYYYFLGECVPPSRTNGKGEKKATRKSRLSHSHLRPAFPILFARFIVGIMHQMMMLVVVP